MFQQKICATAVMLIMLSPWDSNVFKSIDPGLRDLPKEAKVNANKDLEIIRRRVIHDLLEPPVREAEIKGILNSVNADGSWPDIDYKDVSRTGFQHARHLENMFELGRAYKKPESLWYQHPEVKEVALSALDFWLQHDFICDNWWWNEMGTPGRMINTLLVIDTDLNENQIREGLRIAGRANLEASGARPGGDLIQIAGMLGKQALFRRDETVLERVVGVMADEIKITTGRGLKPDMSFHHRVDNVICTLSYGLGYANAFSYWAVKISGTKYRFPDAATQLLIDYFLDGVCKSMVYGKFPDPGAKNRDLSRRGTLHAAGSELAENLLKTSDYRKAELEEIVKIRKGAKKPELTWNRFFWHSEYFTHQRPDYFTSIRMHSSRNHTMEQPHNEEGLKMHHVGDGSNFISLTGTEYLDIFPVWDWQKIPGTTVVQKHVHPHWNQIAKKGLTDFVGGVSDGKYGAAAFDLKSAHDALSARKAWFFFDDEYVCLGTEISAEAEYPVFTTLNQCLLKSEVVVKTKKEAITLEKGNHSLSSVSWVLHDGVGYVFPALEKINLTNKMATGNWREINHQAATSDEPVRAEVFALWLDHGVKPQHVSYEYIVVPGTERTFLEDYSKNSQIEILSNTQEIQAVVHKGMNRSQIVFYQAGKIRINDNISLSAASPCMVMVKADGKSIEAISVSDPSRKLSTLQLMTSAQVEGAGAGWEAVWDKKAKQSVINIELPQAGDAGKSVVARTVGL
ncbi:MAG: polysaccharide lyase family 8 super-sandwich domain-containing protein [Cyclobacteriaceae bacterium]